MASDTEADISERSEFTPAEISLVTANEKAGLLTQLMCHFCGMEFDMKKTRSLRAHIEEVHVVGDSGFMCGVCCEEFVSRKAVENHMSTFHRTSKPLGCGTCGETFKVRNLLLKHIDSHSEEELAANKVGLCYCGECFEFFDSVTSLQSHIMNHREQPFFVCGACGLQTDQRHIMVKHLEVHVISNLLSASVGGDSIKADVNNVNSSCSSTSIVTNSNNNICGTPLMEIDESRIQSDEAVILQQSIDDLASTDQLCAEAFESEEDASYKCGVCHVCFNSLAEAVTHAGTHQDAEGTMQQVEINVLMEEKMDLMPEAASADVVEGQSSHILVDGEPHIHVDSAVKTELIPTATGSLEDS